MDDLTPRLRAVCDLDVAEVREYSGRHEYDGTIQDLSPAGVRAGAGPDGRGLGRGRPARDPHDEAHLAAFERAGPGRLGDLELHRRNPLLHLAGLDLACYDREYAPASERDEARRAPGRRGRGPSTPRWPTLDQVSAPVAAALLDGIRGLAAGHPGRTPTPAVAAAALAAHARLVAHIERAAAEGDPDPALGAAGAEPR